MSEINPCHKAKMVVDKILTICEEENVTLKEIEDVPAELQRRISRNINKLKKNTKFTYHD